ncbi:dihydrofolate reductase family protein [Streptomyces sp. M-16]|uniref:dihydrofolate reductase family protein n=1 Tax=Streptomyces sp. M-16 TaxID=3233040 RepID=UPI003F99D17B
MGLIHIELFATLDLVGQAPGGPDEDPVGFPFGGWQAPLPDEVAGAQIGAAYEGTDALLLGRRTYDIFAAYWPHQKGGQDSEIAGLFDSVPKYVASRGRPGLSWAGSTQLGPDLAGAVREIRERHEHVKVVGSLNLVQTLLREKLFDRLDLGCTRSCSASARRCSTTARCPPASRSSLPRRPARRAPCTCATGSPAARPRRGT